MTRRDFLKTGAGVTLIAAGGLAWRLVDQGVFEAGDGPAYAPWENWSHHDNPRSLTLVRSAILAANAHNTQP